MVCTGDHLSLIDRGYWWSDWIPVAENYLCACLLPKWSRGLFLRLQHPSLCSFVCTYTYMLLPYQNSNSKAIILLQGFCKNCEELLMHTFTILTTIQADRLEKYDIISFSTLMLKNWSKWYLIFFWNKYSSRINILILMMSFAKR